MVDFGIAGVVTITVLVAVLTEGVKASGLLDSKWLPVISGVCGLILGLVAFFTHVKDFPGVDWLTSAAIGAVSGFAATGAHQVYSQLCKTDKPESDSTPTNN